MTTIQPLWNYEAGVVSLISIREETIGEKDLCLRSYLIANHLPGA
jgi:hypothetical protein